MGSLENIVSNTARGLGIGMVHVADPLGAAINYIDGRISGAGYSSERSLPTTLSHIGRHLYSKPDENLSFTTGYAPRIAGQLGGAALAATALYQLYLTVPLAAAAIPVALGIYSILGSAGRYLINLAKGEKIEGKHEKGSFFDGFKFGYHTATYIPPIGLIHTVEESLTGRGMERSHLETGLKKNGKKMRRNFSSLAGATTGAILGIGLSAVTLGLLPLYKTVRDIKKSWKKAKAT